MGDRLGDHRLVERLGEGGFAEVFAAEQSTPVERSVALKLVKSTVGAAFGADRMEQERRLMAKLNHPGIATMLDWGATPEGRPYLVMEWVNGDALTHFCTREDLRLNEKLKLMVSVCQAVHHAHLRGVLHLDLKPSNILAQRTDDGALHVKVIDFGIGRLISESHPNAVTSLMGTPPYMSPERLRGGSREGRTLCRGKLPSKARSTDCCDQERASGRAPGSAATLRRIGVRSGASTAGSRGAPHRLAVGNLSRISTRLGVATHEVASSTFGHP